MIEHDPVPILQALLRFDTTNPPGREAEAVGWARQLLSQAGIPSQILELDPQRPNLVARLAGRGNAPPLLLYGHLDVVTVQDQAWQKAPFGGEIADGCIWGRGALDMKAGDAMFLSALLRAQAEGAALPGDVLLALVADEEGGGDYGAGFLAERHPELFSGVRFALGEFGGFAYYFAGRKFYPIMVAEKQICAMRAVIRGPAGHGSLGSRDGTMARLAAFLQALNRKRLPVHITPPFRLMIEHLARELPATYGLALRGLLQPALADPLIAALGEAGRVFAPLLRNTATPTIVRGGDQINVVPCEIQVGLDGRLLPGCSPSDLVSEIHDLISEIRALAGDQIELIVERFDPCPAELDLSLFSTLADLLKKADPEGRPIPLFLPAVTDARFFSRLGIQTYGFIPMNLPPGFNFTQLVHAADERIPVDAVRFGAEVIFQAIQNFK